MRAGGRAGQPRRRLDKWVGSRGGPTMSAAAQAGGRSRRAGHTAAAQLLHAAARPQGCVFLALRLRRTYTPTWTAGRRQAPARSLLYARARWRGQGSPRVRRSYGEEGVSVTH